VPYCQKYISADCFFGDFAYREICKIDKLIYTSYKPKGRRKEYVRKNCYDNKIITGKMAEKMVLPPTRHLMLLNKPSV